jgi:cystathionine beta-lyase/cystathionine gamma-synthase
VVYLGNSSSSENACMPARFNKNWDFQTQMVHAGERLAHPPGKPSTTPLYMSTTYYHEDMAAFDQALGGHGYAYGRNGNPTNTALEIAATAAEAGAGALTTASGMSAIYTAILAAGMSLGRPLAHIVAARDMYGATTVLLRDFLAPYGVTVHTCDLTNLAELDALIAAHAPDVIYAEQLSNPLFRVVDMAAIAQRAQACGARTVVDNTIATPIVQQPLLLGVDFVAHSATKYFSGHGDATGGLVIVRQEEYMAPLRHINATLGMVLGPFEALQILRGIKTMPLRVERQCHNALEVAQWLAAHPAVATVHYPGLATHRDYATAQQTLNGKYGAMLAFELTQSHAVQRFADALELVLPASTLGDIYTMISVPALASHRGLSATERHARGISDSLIRMSVGIEQAHDIIADLAHALTHA